MHFGSKDMTDGDRVSGTMRCDRRAVEFDDPATSEYATMQQSSWVCDDTSQLKGRLEAAEASGSVPRDGTTLGWLEGIPVPAALVTPTGEIAAASRGLSAIVDNVVVIGRTLMSFLWPESRDQVAAMIARPPMADDATRALSVTMLGSAETYRMRVGSPLGNGRSAMRLVLLQPEHDSDGERPRRSVASGSIPAPPNGREGPLRALGGLPLTAIVVADGRVVTVTQRAATLLGLPALSFESMPVEELLGEAAAAEIWAESTKEGQRWQPQALPAIPIRVNGAIRGSACCLIPFGRPGVGLILMEGWGGTLAELPTDHARQSSAGYLIAGVAHEINNPLTFILPTLKDLHHELQLRRDSIRGIPVDSWISQLEEVLEGVTRISAVVQNLRVAREVTPDAEPTSVNQVIANTVRLAAASVPHGIAIRRDLGLVLPARANRQRLGQVLLNLVLNAAHALEDSKRHEGTIFVRSWTDEHFTWLEVRDDGPGVAEDHRERIFEPFFTTRAKGSGLGLAVCRAMIRELGGELTLERVPTEGACFRIRLPIWQESKVTDREPAQKESAANRNDSTRRRVLLVDDDQPVRRALRRMLARHHSVEEAGSIQEAIDKAQQVEFDVLVTDLVMSHGGGPALIERLKQLGSPLSDHVVIISGMAPDATPTRYPRLSKPCTSEGLLEAVEKAARCHK